jgi:hypothetical protein
MARVNRQTEDLSDYPDLVVIYLGMQVYSLRGLRALVAEPVAGRTVQGPPVIAEDALP